jgi:DNA-binding PadR family transcriptional regulator
MYDISILDMTPLSMAAFYTLFALAEDEQHGYAIMQAAKAESAGAFSMGPATLYTTIGRLLDAGLIEETTNSRPADARTRGRRFYRLTATGHEALDEELRRMARAVKSAQLKKLMPRRVE